MDTGKLIQKLGLKPTGKAYLLHAPTGYTELLRIPKSVVKVQELEDELDWVQAFYTGTASLRDEIDRLAQQLAKTGQLWISWPKKTSGIDSNLSDAVVREIGLQAGLVDVKIAAIDQTWSGLKFVYRLHDR